MKNYLHIELKEYFKEITKIEGYLLVVEGFIDYSEKKLVGLLNDSDSYSSLRSTYRDLSDLTSSRNLYSTGCRYKLKKIDFEKDLSLIISRECCFALTQAYEIFESFL